MTDIADLGFKLESDGIDRGIRKIDQLDKAEQNLEKTAKRSGGQIDKSMRDASKGIDKANKSTKTLGASFSGIGSLVSVLGFGAAVTGISEYAGALQEVSTLVDTSTFNMEQLSGAALDQARQFGTMPTAGINAFYQAVSAGADTVVDSTEAMIAANKLAIGGVTDIETSVDGLTSVMNAYAGEAGSFTDISDAMFVSVRAGKTTVDEIARSIGNVAPIAAQTGVAFEEILAANAALTKGGIDTKAAMNGLRAIMAAVAKPTKDAADTAEKLGLNFNAAALETQGLSGFLAEVQRTTGGSAEELAKLFGGVEALVPIMSLLGNDSAEFNRILAQMADKAGITEEAFTKMSQSPGFQINRIMASLTAEVLGFSRSITNSAVPVLTSIADAIPLIFDRVEDTFASVKNAYRDFISVFEGSPEWNNFISGVSALGGFLAPVVGYLDEFAIAFVAVGGGLAAATAVVGVLTSLAAVALSPVALGIGAVAAGAVVLQENWDGVVNWWQGIWSRKQEIINGFIDWWDNTTFAEKAADIVTGGIDLARSTAGAFVEWWNNSELKKHTPEFILEGIETVSSAAADFFDWWNSTTLTEKAADITYGTLQLFFDTAVKIHEWWKNTDFDDAMVDFEFPSFSEIKEKISSFVTSITDGIQEGFERFIERNPMAEQMIDQMLADLARGGRRLVDAVKDIGGDIVAGLKEGIAGKLEDLKQFVFGWADSLPNWMKNRLGIQSPSIIFKVIGGFIMEGLSIGLSSNIGLVESAMGQIDSFLVEKGRELNRGITNAILDADSIRDAFNNIGDFLKNWLEDQIRHFAANQITAFIGLGDSGSGLLGGLGSLFGQGGSGGVDLEAFGGAGGAVAGGSGAAGGAGAAGGVTGSAAAGIVVATAVGLSMAGEIGKTLSKIFGGDERNTRNGAIAGTALLGPLGLLGGAAIGSALGGSTRRTNAGFDIGFEDGQVTGNNFEQFERRRSLFRGTRRTERTSELDADVEASVQDYFTNLNDTIVSQAERLGVAGADSILAGFSVQTQRFSGETAEADLAMFLENSTRDAYQLAFNNLDPILQDLISSRVDIFTGSLEDIDAVFNGLGESAFVVENAVKTLNLNFDAAGPLAIKFSDALVELAGGAEAFTAQTSGYFNDFYSEAEKGQLVLASAAGEVKGFNDALGLSGDAAIDTKDEFRAYVESLDLTTAAGREAFNSAMMVSGAMATVAESGQSLEGAISSLPDHLRVNFVEMNDIVASGSDEMSSLTQMFVNDMAQMTGSMSDETRAMVGDFRDMTSNGLESLVDDSGMMMLQIRDSGGELLSSMGTNAEDLRDVMNGTGNQMVTDWATNSGQLLSTMDDTGELLNISIATRGGEMVSSMAVSAGDMVSVVRGMGNSFSEVGDSINNTAGNIRAAANDINFAHNQALRASRAEQADQGFAKGLARVPSDGYYKIHRNEMIVPAETSAFLRKAGIPLNNGQSSGSADTSNLQNAIGRLEQQVQDLNQANQYYLAMLNNKTDTQTAKLDDNQRTQDRLTQKLAKLATG